MFADAPLAKLLEGGVKLKIVNTVVYGSVNLENGGTKFVLRQSQHTNNGSSTSPHHTAAMYPCGKWEWAKLWKAK